MERWHRAGGCCRSDGGGPTPQALTRQCASPRRALQASWLKAQGVRRGDFVCIYMPMILELPYAMVRFLK